MQSWIITMVAIVVAVCAALAALGFRGRVTTIGVDLGTTFSVVCININGKVVIISDKKNNTLFPSVVSYLPQGDILVSHNALPQLSLNPENTIFNSKRFIGKSLNDTETALYASAHPFTVVSIDNHSISNFSHVGFQLANITGHHPDIVSPEEIGTQILKYLLKVTSDFLGHSQVNKAVICVPAKFSLLQREATGMAYKKAGLKVVRVLEEPTAAAVAYDLHKKENIHHILVYDFGGGTLDVSLLYVANGSVQVYATDGDDTLGGSDFDLCLYDILRSKIETLSGHLVKLHSLSENDRGLDNSDLCLSANVRTMAEQIKKDLSYNDEIEFQCRIPIFDETEITSTTTSSLAANKEEKYIKFKFSKSEFQNGCSSLFQRGLVPVTRLLTDLAMDRSDIDEIVMVGGTTRIPFVKSQLRDFFGKDLNDHIDPDVTVAMGAASILD